MEFISEDCLNSLEWKEVDPLTQSNLLAGLMIVDSETVDWPWVDEVILYAFDASKHKHCAISFLNTDSSPFLPEDQPAESLKPLLTRIAWIPDEEVQREGENQHD